MKCQVTIEGTIPKSLGIGRAELRRLAGEFADRSSLRIGEPFRAVAVVLQNDDSSSEAHMAIMGVDGPTDVITQRYDAMPGEAPGIYGELYVNIEQAMRVAPKRKGWSVIKELLLYVAHGMDHLSGADDHEAGDYRRMRRRELAWLRQIC